MRDRRFGRLVAVERAPDRANRPYWECRCDCGRVVTVQASALQNRNTKSCGCLRRESTTKRNTIHGLTKDKGRTPEYSSWANAKGRCFEPNGPGYARYGGRGITMCKEWSDGFAAFLRDMGPKPSSAHSLDRINNDGDYEPGNCRWATRIEQNNNTRRNSFIVVRGARMTVAEAARQFGIHQSCLRERLSKGIAPDIAILHRGTDEADAAVRKETG